MKMYHKNYSKIQQVYLNNYTSILNQIIKTHILIKKVSFRPLALYDLHRYEDENRFNGCMSTV